MIETAEEYERTRAREVHVMTEERETYSDYSVDDDRQPGAARQRHAQRRRDSRPRLLAAGALLHRLRRYAVGKEHSPRRSTSDTAGGAGQDPYAGAAPGSGNATEQQYLDDGEVGDRRAGRLVDPDQGFGEDSEKDLVGEDVGIDDGAASAEEAAMHVVADDEWTSRSVPTTHVRTWLLPRRYEAPRPPGRE